MVMNSEISLIINCHQEDLEYIDTTYFNDKYARIYININPNDKEYLSKIINNIETEYYSILNFNKDYKDLGDLGDLDILLNKKYKKIEHITNPIISVIVCLYNTKPELFINCINGLINQTFKNFEVLIVNDGSDKYYIENKNFINNLNDNRFIWINKEHSGKSQTLNLGLEKAKGKYIAINDSDDISYPERLEYQYKWLESHREYDLISNAFKQSHDCKFCYNIKSTKVTNKTLHYLCIHPTYMFNKKTVLQKIPFLFESIYDSMEDAVLNHIMFYYNVQMYYDNKVLLIYNTIYNGVHLENYKGLKYHMSNNLFFKTFNINKKDEITKLGCVLICNNWDVELEKTILNIKLTSNNINIYVLYYGGILNNINTLNKYQCNIYQFQTYIDCLNYVKNNIRNEYLFIISNPIRCYNKNWDIDIIDYFEYYPDCINIIQPKLYKINKEDTNLINYANKEIINVHKIVRLFNKLTVEIEPNNQIGTLFYRLDNDECISSELVFFTKNTWFKNIDFNNIISPELLNVYLSFKSKSNYFCNTIEIGTVVNNSFNNLNDNYKHNKNIILEYIK